MERINSKVYDKTITLTVPILKDQVWGWLPVLCVTGSTGLLLISLAFNRSRQGAWGAELLFWLGLLLLTIPTVARLSARDTTRQERIGIVVLFALALYLIKILYSPLLFTFGDELQHWRTTYDILATQHLFAENSILPVSPYYPGLEILTHAVASLTGLSIFKAGLLVVGLARLVLILGIFLFFEWISGSDRISGLAIFIYMANPHFLFFDAQFGYESLAIAFVALTLYATSNRIRWPGMRVFGLTLVSLLGILAAIITHHVTSYFLSAFLSLAALISLVNYRWRKAHYGLDGLALISIIGSLAWLVYVATLAIEYLTPTLQIINELGNFLSGQSPTRQFFQTESGESAPLWLQIPSYASVLLILLWLPVGLFQVWRKHRSDALVMALALIALLYPFLQILRLTPYIGLTVLQRSMPFTFLGIGLVLALGFALSPQQRYLAKAWRSVSILSILVIFLGTISSNLHSWSLPGPIRIGSYTQSVGFQNLEAAAWSRQVLGPGNRFGSDPYNQLVIGSYGEQRSVTDQADRIWLETTLRSSEFDEDDRSTLARGEVRYLLVDLRRVQLVQDALTATEQSYPGARVTKFDRLDRVDRIFDSGEIRIYDVGIFLR